jgi:hypothetical protein
VHLIVLRLPSPANGSKHEKDARKDDARQFDYRHKSIPPIVASSVLFDAFVEVSKTAGMSRQGLADQLREYARQIEAMGDDEYDSGVRSPIQ